MRIPSEQQVDGVSIRNYGDTHFYPEERLQDGLEEVLIFNENTRKRDIPNGSVWTYQANSPYNPDILSADVGCGITRYEIQDDIPSKNNATDTELNEYIDAVWSAADKLNTTIGRGNHFIDFTTYHSFRHSNNGHALFIHSDMNPSQTTPTTYEEAKVRTKEAKERREETAERLLDQLGLDHEQTGDWPHNTVERNKDHLIYRKGSINLSANKRNGSSAEGLLGMTPSRGLFSYAARLDFDSWESLRHSMQHGVGKITSQNMFYRNWPNRRENKKEVYRVASVNKALEQNYQSITEFTEPFGSEIRGLGVYRPEYILRTN